MPQNTNALKVNDVCKSGGIETGPGINRMFDCPTNTVCKHREGEMAIGGEVKRYCLPSKPISMSENRIWRDWFITFEVT
jgi:hypothetical protein